MNRTILMGRLTRDPELRQTNTGTQVCSFTLAVDRRVSKNTEKKTDFIDCVAWDGTAEFVAKHFVKANRMLVDGRLQIREWTDKEGNKRRNAEVIADNIEFVERKQYAPETSNDDVELEEEDDDDLPF